MRPRIKYYQEKLFGCYQEMSLLKIKPFNHGKSSAQELKKSATEFLKTKYHFKYTLQDTIKNSIRPIFL